MLGLRLLPYPLLALARLYFGGRYFLNGRAGSFAAKTQAFYAPSCWKRNVGERISLRRRDAGRDLVLRASRLKQLPFPHPRKAIRRPAGA